MKNSEIKALIESNADLRSDLQSYINSYVEFVRKEIPSGFEVYFGVGITSDNRFGTYWGFYNRNKDCFTCTGSGWNVGNDWDLKILGSNHFEMRAFAEEIPSLIKSGISEIEKENKAISELLTKKISFGE